MTGAAVVTQARMDAASMYLIGVCVERKGDPENGRHMLDVAARRIAELEARLAEAVAMSTELLRRSEWLSEGLDEFDSLDSFRGRLRALTGTD